MARTNNLTNFLTDVATAIKAKIGDNTPIQAANFDTAIMSITTGGNYQQKSITLQQNGTFNLLPDTGYDAMDSVTMTVDVSGEPMDPTTATVNDVINPKTFYSNGQKLTGAIIPTYGEPVPEPLQTNITYNSSYNMWHVSYNKNLALVKVNDTSFAVAKIVNGVIDFTSMVTHTVSSVSSTSYNIIDCKFADTNLSTVVIWLFGKVSDRSCCITRCVLNTTDLSITSSTTSSTIALGYNYVNNNYFAVRPGYDTDVAVIIGYNSSLSGRLAIRLYRYDSTSNTFTLKLNDDVQTRSPNYFNTVPAYGYWTADGNYLLGQTTVNNTIKIFSVDTSGNATQTYSSGTFRRVLNGGYYLQGTTVYTPAGVAIGTSVIDFSQNTSFSLIGNLIFIRNSASTTALYQITSEYNITKVKDITTYNSVWFVEQTSSYLYCSAAGTLSGYGVSSELDITALNRNSKMYYDTSDTDGIASNVLFGKKVYNNTGKIIGTMPNNGAVNITPSTSSQSIPAGYTSGGTVSAVTAAIDADITANNIKYGVDILGVSGTLSSMTKTEYDTAVATAYDIYPYVVRNLFNKDSMYEYSQQGGLHITNTGFEYLRAWGGGVSTAVCDLTNLVIGTTYCISMTPGGDTRALANTHIYVDTQSSDAINVIHDFTSAESGTNVVMTFTATQTTMYFKVMTSEAYFNWVSFDYVMMNEGSTAQSYIPYTADQSLQPNLDAILLDKQTNVLPGNIKNGESILGVVGTYTGIDTSDATATTDDIINPKTAYVNGAKVTGGMIPTYLLDKDYTRKIYDWTFTRPSGSVLVDISAEIGAILFRNNGTTYTVTLFDDSGVIDSVTLDMSDYMTVCAGKIMLYKDETYIYVMFYGFNNTTPRARCYRINRSTLTTSYVQRNTNVNITTVIANNVESLVSVPGTLFCYVFKDSRYNNAYYHHIQQLYVDTSFTTLYKDGAGIWEAGAPSSSANGLKTHIKLTGDGNYGIAYYTGGTTNKKWFLFSTNNNNIDNFSELLSGTTSVIPTLVDDTYFYYDGKIKEYTDVNGTGISQSVQELDNPNNGCLGNLVGTWDSVNTALYLYKYDESLDELSRTALVDSDVTDVYYNSCNISQIATNRWISISPKFTNTITSLNKSGILYSNTSDAVATNADICSGKTAYVNGYKISGNMKEVTNPASIGSGYDGAFFKPDDAAISVNGYGCYTVTDTQGLHPGEQYLVNWVAVTNYQQWFIKNQKKVKVGMPYADVANKIGLTANKIKLGETILGVTGTYDGSSDTIVYLDYLDINGCYFDTGVNVSGTKGMEITLAVNDSGHYVYFFHQGSAVDLFPWDITTKELTCVLINSSTNTEVFYNNETYFNAIMAYTQNKRAYIKMSGNSLYTINDDTTVANTFGTTLPSSQNTLIINPRASAVDFKFYGLRIFNVVNGQEQNTNYFLPCIFNGNLGIYDIVTKTFYKKNTGKIG